MLYREDPLGASSPVPQSSQAGDLSVSDTPVLFIGFNRPEQSREVFDALATAAPTRLYVAIDGARADRPGEDRLVAEVRGLFEAVDWDCEVTFLDREENLGCKLAVSGAIDWFFDNEEAGVILEDDCVPDPSFFPFCAELLERYRDDTRVMHIAGYNHRPDYVWDPDYSYFFSEYGYMWGWATWRRAWALYDIELPTFDEIVEKDYLRSALPGRLARRYHLKKIRDAVTGVNDTWDYQWDFVRMSNSGLSIVPHSNLIRNIGFGEDATHTVSANNPSLENLAVGIDFPLRHPEFMVVDRRSDRAYFNGLVRWTIYRKLMGLLGRRGYETAG